MPSRLNIPTIALVGRTNVGKSTLFNKLIERREALVSRVAGTTRDRKEGECIWRGRAIRVIDTGGLDVEGVDEIEKNTIKQALVGVKQADIVLFVVDVSVGPMPQERALASQLRKSGKPIIVVGNKAERPRDRKGINDPAWRAQGLPAPMPVSAIRGMGVGDVLDAVWDELKILGKEPAEIAIQEVCRVAVIGKPNVGKSSLLNAILREERFIVSEIAHTTREPNDTLVETEDGRAYIFIDTAGMRKKAKVKHAGGLEEAGVRRNEQIIREADVALLVVDASEPLGTQERTLAGLLEAAQVGIIVIANKWDLVEEKTSTTINRYRDYLHRSLPFLQWAPILFVSAKTGQRADTIMDTIDAVQKARHTTITQSELDRVLGRAISGHLPSRGKGPKPPKILGIKQTSTTPPTFELAIKARRLDVLHNSWLRYLENRMREQFELSGTPVIIKVKGIISVQ